MHIQIKYVAFAAIIVLLSHDLCFSQNQFKIPDMNPSRDTGNRNTSREFSEQAPQGNQKSTLPPIAPGSLYKNDLRGSGGTLADGNISNSKTFDSQPVPPQPRSNGNAGQMNAPRSQQGNSQGFAGQGSTRSQNPADQLNPNRLTQNTPLAPAQDQSGQASRVNRQSLPPMDVRSEISQRPSAGQAIPTIDSSMTTPSNISPRISSNISDDSQVVATTYSNPIQQNQAQRQAPIGQDDTAKANPARNLLKDYDVSSSTRPLPGVPVSLKDLMRTTPLQYRHTMVQQYWVTYFDWATLNNSIMYSQWLNQLPNPRVPAEQKLIQTAKSMAKNDIVAAEIQLSKSQSKLQQLSRTNSQELLPLPLNQPLVSKYKTHYQWYQTRNLIPAKLKGINEMLPRTYQLLDLRAATATQAKNTRNQFKQSFTSGQASIGDLLESGRIWQSAVQSYVSTVVNYNRAISDYALTIAPKQNSLDQVVSMLVAKPKSVNEIAARNSVLERNSRPTNLAPQAPQERFAQQPNFNNTANNNVVRSQRTPQANNRSNANQRANNPNSSGFNTTFQNPSQSNQRPPANRTGNQAANSNALPPTQFRSSSVPDSQFKGQGGTSRPTSGGGGFKPSNDGGAYKGSGGNFGG